MTYKPVCWSFSSKEKPDFPIIPIEIAFPVSESPLILDFKIDTGYAGVLGITTEVIEQLHLQNLGFATINTPTGEKNVPYYLLEIENTQWGLSRSKAYGIETPRLLAGRSLFKGKKILLDFEEQQSCILLDES